MLSSLLRRTGLTTTLVRPQLLLTAQSISGFFVWRFASHKSKAPTGQESRKAEAISEHDKNRSIDTDKPKRPLNAYMLFFAEFLAHNAQFNRRSAMRPSAVAWKTLNTDEKQKFETQYAADLSRHHLELKMWQDKMIAEGRLELLQKSMRAKACADIGKPKHPASPFIHFLTSQAKADQPRSIVCKAAGEAWRKLSDAEKKKYNPNYAAEMRDYVEKMRLWKEKMIADGRESILSVRKRKKPNEAKKGKVSKAIIADDDEGFE